MAARIERAQRKAAAARAPQTETIAIQPARWAPSYGGEFWSLLAEGPNMNAIGMGPEHYAGEPLRTEPLLANWIDQAHRRARAFGAAMQETAVAVRQRLGPAVGRPIGQAPRRARARGVALRQIAVATSQQLKPALQRGMGLSIAAWQRLGPPLARTMDQARRHVHAMGVAARELGVAAWQAPASRFVMAGVTVITAAIAASFLLQPHEMAPPAVVPPAVVSAGIAGPSAALPPQSAGPPTIDHPLPGFTPAAPSPEPGAGGPAEAHAFLGPRLKPPPPLPTLMAELKPPLIEARPLPPLPVPPQTRKSPDEMRDDPRAADNMLGSMFSTGVKHKQRRQR